MVARTAANSSRWPPIAHRSQPRRMIKARNPSPTGSRSIASPTGQTRRRPTRCRSPAGISCANSRSSASTTAPRCFSISAEPARRRLSSAMLTGALTPCSPSFPIGGASRETPGRRYCYRHGASARGFANEGLPHRFPTVMRDQAGDTDSIQERVADRVETPRLEREINGHGLLAFFDFLSSRTLR
jgi:hypothetical protein